MCALGSVTNSATPVTHFANITEPRAAASDALERSKLATAGEVAEANERAADARLKTEQLKKEVAWRELDPLTARRLDTELSKSPSSVTLVYVPDDPEATQYCVQFVDVFRRAKWKVEVAGRRFLGPPTGIVVTHNDKWNPEIQADIERVRIAFAAAGVPIEIGGRGRSESYLALDLVAQPQHSG